MTTKDFILEQLAATRNKKNWFVPLSDAVSGLTSEQAKWKDNSGNHSVWQIVNHLIFWNGRWLIRLNGEVPPKIETENSGTFAGDLGGNSEWESSFKKLNEIMGEIETKVKAMSNEELKQEPFKGYDASWYEMFAQMTIHNAYHIGQIVHLRKQQGVWNPEQGVN